MKELQRIKRLELEKEFKDTLETNKIDNKKELEDITQRGNQLKREFNLMKGEFDRRLFEMGEDNEDLKSKLEQEISQIKNKVRFDIQNIQNSCEEFETKNKLKWDELLDNYQQKIQNFQGRE